MKLRKPWSVSRYLDKCNGMNCSKGVGKYSLFFSAMRMFSRVYREQGVAFIMVLVIMNVYTNKTTDKLHYTICKLRAGTKHFFFVSLTSNTVPDT